MSHIASPNQDLLDSFLHEIEYGIVVQNLQERSVLLDWEQVFARVIDTTGTAWVQQKGDAGVAYGMRGLPNAGVYRANLLSGDRDHIRVEVYATRSARAALDLMLQQASLVTTMRINDNFFKSPACFADFCLERKYDSDKEARFTFGNVFVHIFGQRDTNTKSVIPVAKTLCEIMRVAVQRKSSSMSPGPVLRISLTRPSLKVGEKVTVAVDTTNYPEEAWEVDIRVKGEKLEYIDGDFGKEEYEAKAAGTETVKAVLMNKKTLQLAEAEKQITIEP